MRAERNAVVARAVVAELRASLIDAGPKNASPLGTARQLVIGAEALVVEIVVFLDDDRFIGKLRHEVIGGIARRAEGIDQRGPAGAVGMDRPDGPQPQIAQPCDS